MTVTEYGIRIGQVMWDCKFFWDGDDVDIEGTAQVKSPFLHYPGSSLVEVDVSVSSTRDDWSEDLLIATQEAISTVNKGDV